MRAVLHYLFIISSMPVRSKVRVPASDEAGVLEELDEDLVDKLVLGDGLHHQHPLLPQPGQQGGNLHWLKGRK